MFAEETPDVFLAKATLQQYLSRVVRKDWDGARRLTHPKTLGGHRADQKRTGNETHELAPWANRDAQLQDLPLHRIAADLARRGLAAGWARTTSTARATA